MVDRSRETERADAASRGRRESRSFARESGRQRRRRARRQPIGFDELDFEDAEYRALEGRPAAYDVEEEEVALDEASLEDLQEIAEEMDIEDYDDMSREELLESIREQR